MEPVLPTLPSPYSVDKHIVYKGLQPVGILNPSIQIGFIADERKIQIVGPAGALLIEPASSLDYLDALIATRSLLLGGVQSILAAQRHLLNDATSRTAAYLCSIANSCEEIAYFFERIRNSSIAIIGCGGIGSLCAMILAGAGIRNLTLVDPDTIEVSNFNRQFFWTMQDIGQPKVEILKKRLSERYSDMTVRTHKEMIRPESIPGVMRDVDGVVFTADEPIGLVRIAREIAADQNKLFVTGGYLLSEAVMSASAAPRGADNRKLFPLQQKIAPSFGPTNVEVAGVLANYTLLLLSGMTEDEALDISWKVHEWPWKN